MKTRSAVLIFSAILIFLSGVSPVFSQDKSSLLQERCNDYYRSLAEGRYDKMWDMSVREIKNEVPRDDYAAYFKEVFKNYTSLIISGVYNQCAKLVEGRDDAAISKAFVYFKNAKESIGGCNLAVFLWREDNWYFFAAFDCEYENDIPKIFKDLKSF